MGSIVSKRLSERYGLLTEGVVSTGIRLLINKGVQRAKNIASLKRGRMALLQGFKLRNPSSFMTSHPSQLLVGEEREPTSPEMP